MRPSTVAHPGPTTSLVLYWLGRAWLAAFGWDVEGEPPQTTKGILIAAPHTSNWDLPHMLAAAFVFRLKISWLGKHTLFRPPFGGLMRALGGIPIERSTAHGAVKAVADKLAAAERLVIAVPPSGTRSKRDHWKSGFYWMAHTAQVPVICGTLDYSRKRAGLGFLFVPTGDVKADMDLVRAYYADKRGKVPANESTIVLKEESEDADGAGEGHHDGRATEPLAG